MIKTDTQYRLEVTFLEKIGSKQAAEIKNLKSTLIKEAAVMADVYQEI